jgi:hypothetical protein
LRAWNKLVPSSLPFSTEAFSWRKIHIICPFYRIELVNVQKPEILVRTPKFEPILI